MPEDEDFLTSFPVFPGDFPASACFLKTAGKQPPPRRFPVGNNMGLFPCQDKRTGCLIFSMDAP